MICLTKPAPKPRALFTPITSRPNPPPLTLHLHPPISNSYHEQHRRKSPPRNSHLLNLFLNPTTKPLLPTKKSTNTITRTSSGSSSHVGIHQMGVLCGFGYWVQGFRCYPWLALNFHMVHALGLSPSTLQLVQHTGNLPMVAKPLFGVITDGICIGGAHRLPYISIGVLLQVLSWGTLALMPATGEAFAMQMACILVSSLGASVTEVVSDAFVAEFSRTKKVGELQSYAFIALAAGSLLGNLSGGFILQKTQEPKVMFFTFALLLTIQLALSLTTKGTSLYSSPCLNHLVWDSVLENISKQFSELTTTINDERIFYPLSWVVASVTIVPLFSGSIFCFQTQFLMLDPSIIGLSKVTGQFMVLTACVFYNHYLKQIPLRKLIFGVQILYALSLLLDLFLVKQINLKMGISNKVYVICLSAAAEALAQFKLLPFTVLFSNLCPAGCEGSLFAFLASAFCLSSILSGIFGVGLASLIGVTSGDYSSLPLGIVLQSIVALVPLGWISFLPITRNVEKKKGKMRSRNG